MDTDIVVMAPLPPLRSGRGSALPESLSASLLQKCRPTSPPLHSGRSAARKKSSSEAAANHLGKFHNATVAPLALLLTCADHLQSIRVQKVH